MYGCSAIEDVASCNERFCDKLWLLVLFLGMHQFDVNSILLVHHSLTKHTFVIQPEEVLLECGLCLLLVLNVLVKPQDVVDISDAYAKLKAWCKVLLQNISSLSHPDPSDN